MDIAKMSLTASKRSHANESSDPSIIKKQKSDDESNIDIFVSWLTENNFNLSPDVEVRKNGSCAQYGLVATADIPKGTQVFQVQRSIVLSPETSRIADTLKEEQDALQSESGWAPLLLAIIYETHTSESPWKPYLTTFPAEGALDLPMFWTQSERSSELAGTGLVEAVSRDERKVGEEFTEVALPVMERHLDLFPPEVQSVDVYRRAAAFVMAYSFTEPLNDEDDDDEDDDSGDEASPRKSAVPVMVPLADALNHVAANNARLEWRADALVMTTSAHVKAGEEIFNTYGELPNSQLLHMYGFSQAPELNHWNTVELGGWAVRAAARELCLEAEKDLLDAKLSFLDHMDVLSEESGLVLGREGLLTEDEARMTFKVLGEDEETFRARRQQEQDGWAEDPEEEEEEELSLDTVGRLSAPQKALLRRAAELCISRYGRGEEEEQKLAGCVSGRPLFSCYVRLGHLRLLTSLIQAAAP